MKRLIASSCVLATVFAAAAQTQKVTVTVETPSAQADGTKPVPPATPRKVALIVRPDDDESGERVPLQALTEALTAKLAGCGLLVINPNNSIGMIQNRNACGEKASDVSALERAKQLKADGAITASISGFLDTTIGTPPVMHQYSIYITLNILDAWTGATVVEGETVSTNSFKYTNNQVAQKKPKILRDLMYSVADECAARLKKNHNLLNWTPTPPSPPRPKKLPPPIGTSLDHKVDALVREMLKNAQFVKNYEDSKAKQDGRLPIAVIGGIENKSGNVRLDDLLEAAGERFRVKLFNSKLFEVKDDGVLVALAKRIVASGNSPLEDGEIMGALKQHGSPDFFVVGDLRHLTDLDGVGYYKLRIAIHNLSTGKIVWEDIETFNTKKEVTK